WDLYRSVFADDFVAITPGGVVEGIEPFLEYVMALPIQVSVHHGHMPEIELISSTAATGIWAMEDHVRFTDGNDMHGYGHYFETYEKSEGRWRIKTLELFYLRMEMSPSVPNLVDS